jgi:hypothetical protein
MDIQLQIRMDFSLANFLELAYRQLGASRQSSSLHALAKV